MDLDANAKFRETPLRLHRVARQPVRAPQRNPAV